MTYVLIRSWHVIALIYRSGAVKTRCGRGPLRVEGTLIDGDSEELIHPTAATLPLEERSCETCLRLSAHDAEPPDVENDPVDPGPADDVVPG